MTLDYFELWGVRLLTSIRLFLRVVQDGSLSAAARKFNLSPASASRRISALEAELDMQLLLRTSRKVMLTEAGEIYHRRIKAIIEDMHHAEESARQLQDDAQGLLRVHSRTSVGIQLIAPAIKAFCLMYPKVVVELQLSESSINLMEQHFDVDIRLGELEDSSLLMRKLAPSERVMVATPDYLANHPPIRIPQDLLHHNCLTYRLDSEPTSWRAVRHGEPSCELKINGSFHCNNAEALRRAALSGLGIALLTDWGVGDDIREGRLKHVLPDYRMTNYSFNNGIYAVFTQARYISRKVRVFVDFLVERMQSTVPLLPEYESSGHARESRITSGALG